MEPKRKWEREAGLKGRLRSTPLLFEEMSTAVPRVPGGLVTRLLRAGINATELLRVSEHCRS